MHKITKHFVICFFIMKDLIVKCENGLRFAHQLTTTSELKTRPISLMHAHKAYEIYYLESGDVKYTIADKVYHVEPGCIVVLNAYVLHKVDVAPTEDYQRYVLECPINYVPTINGVNPLNRFFNTNSFVNIIPKEYVEKTNVLELLKKMESEYKEDDPYSNYILNSYIIQYVIAIARIVDAEQNIKYNFVNGDDKNSEFNNRIIQFINDNIRNKISLDDIADAMNFSRSYIQHVFKEGVGVSISQYILIQKMQTANFLLEEGKSLKEVANELGYKYYPTFFSAYKKFFGYNPKERKLNK